MMETETNKFPFEGKLSLADVVKVTTASQKNMDRKIEDENYMAEILEAADILQQRHVMVTDSLSKEGEPLIVLYENPKFISLKLEDFRHAFNYLLAILNQIWEQKKALVIIDRRKEKWRAVKMALEYLDMIPLNKISKILILKPTGFLTNLLGGGEMKQLNTLSRHEVVLLESYNSLLPYIEESALPVEFGGSSTFNHIEWIELRTAVERFEITCRKTEDRLKYLRTLFTRREPLTSIPDIKEIAQFHRQMLADVEDDISCTKDVAESHETIVIKPLSHRNISPLYKFNIDCLNKWTTGLDTMRVELGDLWDAQEKYFEQSMVVCSFELDFGKVSQEILTAIGEVTDRLDIGETMETAEGLMNEFNEFCERNQTHHDDIKELRDRGEKMMNEGHFAKDSIQIRVQEIETLCSKFEELSEKRRELLQTNVDALLCIEKMNTWCKEGVDLLASQPVENFKSADGAGNSWKEIDEFIKNTRISPKKTNSLPAMCRKLDSNVIKEKMEDVYKRTEEVSYMLTKREASLKKMCSIAERPVQPVYPQSAGRTNDVVATKRITGQQRRVSSESTSSKENRKSIEIVMANQPQRPKKTLITKRSFKLKKRISFDEPGEEAAMARKMRRVAKELIETEYDYVEDLEVVVEGYYSNFDSPANDIPNILRGKKHVVFGNIVDIYNFHKNIFLKALKGSDGSSSSIGEIFTDNKEHFQLYVAYCKKKPDSERLRQELQSTEYAKGWQSKLGHRLPLDSYLLKPVQRITKYQLLIGEMMKCTDRKSIPYTELKEAQDIMKKVLRYVNDVMHSSGLVGYGKNNTKSLGKLVLQDRFVVWELHKSKLKPMSNLRGKHRQVFLYENAIILSKKELRELDDGKEDYVYQFKDEISTYNIGLTEHVKGDPCKFELTLNRGKDIHVLQAQTEEIKHSWVTEVRKILFHQLDMEKEKVGLRTQKIPVNMPVDTGLRNSAPDIPQLLSPETPAAKYTGSSSPGRKFSFNNAITSPRLDQSLMLQGLRELRANSRSSSDNPLWTTEGEQAGRVYLKPAFDHEGESDDGMWSENEFDYDPEDSDTFNVERVDSKGSLTSDKFDSQSQASNKSREMYTAVADYSAVEETEISFQEGDTLELVEYGEDGWWFMEHLISGGQGWAPASYLEHSKKDTEKDIETDKNLSSSPKKSDRHRNSSTRLETTV